MSKTLNLIADRKRIKDREQSLCRQFLSILNKFEVLASAKIMPGPASEAIFKNLQKVYNFACALAKYFKKKSTATNPAFQSVKYVVMGSDWKKIFLKKYMTKIINFMQIYTRDSRGW